MKKFNNFTSPRGDNDQLNFDFKNEKNFLQQLEEMLADLTRSKSRKTRMKEMMHQKGEKITSRISGYIRWKKHLMKIVTSLKMFCLLGNTSSTNHKNIVTKASSRVKYSITSWSISYWLTFQRYCAKIVWTNDKMYLVNSYPKTSSCCLVAKLENMKCLISSLSNDNHDKDHLFNQTFSNTSFLFRNMSYKELARNFLKTLIFVIARRIHSLYRTQKENYQLKISSCYNVFARFVIRIPWKELKTNNVLPKQTYKSKSLLLCLFLVMFANAEGAKSGGGFGCKNQNLNNLKGASQACLPKEYSKYELPNPSGVNPIKVELLIQEVLRINDKDYSITFSCYYNIYWPDRRIRLSHNFGEEMLTDAQKKNPNFNLTNSPDVTVPMNLEMIKDLWLPNILIYNLKTFKVMDVLSKLAGLWISADYTVLYSTATHITFICPMHFDKFPLDTQSCKFQVGSYSYDDSQMTFTTLRAGYDGKVENSIALDYAIEIRNLSPQDSILLFDGLGNFSLAGFELVLNRYVSTYIITYYLPSGLFVIVSWISFLIPMDVIPGRMALLVTLFLVLVNIFNNVTTNTPKAEGLTAIEAWMLACILFVFGALIE